MSSATLRARRIVARVSRVTVDVASAPSAIEPTPASTAAYAIRTRAPPHQRQRRSAPGEPLTDCDDRAGRLAREVPARCRRPSSSLVSTTPSDRLDDPGHPDRDEQRRDLVGDEDAGAEADQRPEAEDEQAQRQGPQIGPASGNGAMPCAGSAPVAPTPTEPTRKSTPYRAPMPSSDDDLGRHHPHPPGGGQEGRGDRLVPVLRADAP